MSEVRAPPPPTAAVLERSLAKWSSAVPKSCWKTEQWEVWLAGEHQACVGFGKAPRACTGHPGPCRAGGSCWEAAGAWRTQCPDGFIFNVICAFLAQESCLRWVLQSSWTCCLDLGVWVLFCEGSFFVWGFFKVLCYCCVSAEVLPTLWLILDWFFGWNLQALYHWHLHTDLSVGSTSVL